MIRRRPVLFGIWLVSTLLALGASAIVVAGVRRDTRAGQPVLEIDFAQSSDWVAVPFRLWGTARHTLLLSTVSFDSTNLRAPLEGGFEVAVVNGRGDTVFRREYAPGASGHLLPYNYGDTHLATLVLSDVPVRAWSLAARVTAPDARFAPATSELKLWKEQSDPGLGGVVNYLMLIPAGLFLLVGLAAALPLAAQARRLPLIISLAGTAAYVVWVIG